MPSIKELVKFHFQPKGLKLGFFDLDWRCLQARSIVQDYLLRHAVAPSALCHSDEIYTALRVIFIGYNVIGYSYKFATQTTSWSHLTNQCALLSLIWSVTTLVTQGIGYASLKGRKETFSERLLAKELPIRRNQTDESPDHHPISYHKPVGGPFNVQIGTIRSIAIIQKILSTALVPLNLVVIAIYWFLLHDYTSEPDFCNLQVHLFGGGIIIFDWLFDNSIFLLINGWPMPLFGAYYSSWMAIHERMYDSSIYNEIDLQTSFGKTVVVVLNVAVIPVLLCLMALMKHRHTMRVITSSGVLRNGLKDMIDDKTIGISAPTSPTRTTSPSRTQRSSSTDRVVDPHLDNGTDQDITLLKEPV